jgi:pimeloyl-ACP methyl ester carboxylesterase
MGCAMQCTVDGRPVRIKRFGPAFGAARCLVFVHGAGLSSESWGSLPRLCATDGLTALAPDLPGHGASAGTPLPSIADMARWLNAVLAAVGLERPVLVGHSMGALVTLHAAATAAAPVGGLVLLGAGITMPVNAKLLTAARDAPAQAAAMIARWSFRDGRRAGRNPSPTPTMRMGARRLIGTAGPGVLAADLAACDAYADAASMAVRIAAPALVLVCAEDRMTPPAAGTALARCLKYGRAVTIPACGHMPMAEAPRRVQAAIAAFVKELAP